MGRQFLRGERFRGRWQSEELLHKHLDIPNRWVDESVVLSYEGETPGRFPDEDISKRDEWGRGVPFLRGTDLLGQDGETLNEMEVI